MAGLSPRITHAADDFGLVLRMVEQGLGCALVPGLAARCYGVPPGVRLLAVPGMGLIRRTHAVTRPDTTAGPAVRAFVDLLRGGSTVTAG